MGRPFAHISSSEVDVTEIGGVIKDVIENSIIKEKEIHAKDGTSYCLGARPYKTEDQRIDGAVITLQKSFESKVIGNLTHVLLHVISSPFLILEKKLKIFMANLAFSEKIKIPTKTVENAMLTDLVPNWGGINLKNILASVLKSDKDLVQETIEAEFSQIGKQKFNLTIRPITTDKQVPIQLLDANQLKRGKEIPLHFRS